MRASQLLLATALVLPAVALTAARAQQAPDSKGPDTKGTATVLPRGNIEHGQYIVEHVAMCVECHSGRDAAGNILASRRYVGAPIPFAPPWPNDWAIRAPRNAGLPGFDDAMALRLLSEGAIGRVGKQLRPPMPRFRMSRQDAADVIAFMRSLL